MAKMRSHDPWPLETMTARLSQATDVFRDLQPRDAIVTFHVVVLASWKHLTRRPAVALAHNLTWRALKQSLSALEGHGNKVGTRDTARAHQAMSTSPHTNLAHTKSMP